MNTKIKFEYKNVPYVLEYNRMAVKLIENQGFVLSKFKESPMTMVELAFIGSFYANHSKTSTKLIEEIYNQFKNKDALIETLVTMINETYESLLGENENNEGNIEWSAVSGK